MHSKDLNPNTDDTITIRDNMPLGVATPPQLGDTRNFGEAEPVDVPTGNELNREPRVHEDTRSDEAIAEAKAKGEPTPVNDEGLVGRVHTEGGDSPVEVLRDGPDGDANLTNPPLLGDAGGQAALTLPGGPTTQGALNDPNIGPDGTPASLDGDAAVEDRRDLTAGSDQRDDAADRDGDTFDGTNGAGDHDGAAEIEPLDRPHGDEALPGYEDTTRTLGGMSPDGKWYARDNNGESRAFDTEADRDAYVNSQTGWSAYIAE